MPGESEIIYILQHRNSTLRPVQRDYVQAQPDTDFYKNVQSSLAERFKITLQYVHVIKYYIAQNQHTTATCKLISLKNNVEKMKT